MRVRCIGYAFAVDLKQLADRFPDLWHVTFDGGWEGIRHHGILRAIDVAPESCDEFRADITAVSAEGARPVTLRDQKRTRRDPTPCLEDLTPAEWWRLVNGRVYLFVREAGATDLVGSYLRRGHPQEVLKLRTTALLAPLADKVEVTTVNAGVFPRTKGPSRGRSTFVALGAHPNTAATKIREVTVTEPVPVPERAVVSVVRHHLDGHRSRVHP